MNPNKLATLNRCSNRYDRYSEGPPRLGWIFNMLPTSLPDAAGNEMSGLDMYFLEQDGGTFKATVRAISQQ